MNHIYGTVSGLQKVGLFPNFFIFRIFKSLEGFSSPFLDFIVLINYFLNFFSPQKLPSKVRSCDVTTDKKVNRP